MEFDPQNPLRVKRRHASTSSGSEEEEEAAANEQDLQDDISRGKKHRRRQRAIDATEYADDSSDDASRGETAQDPPVSDDDMFGSGSERGAGSPVGEEAKAKATRKVKSAIEVMDMDEFEEEIKRDEEGVVEDDDDGEDDGYFFHEEKKRSDDEDDDDEEEERDADAYFLDPEAEHTTKPRRGPKMDSFDLKDENTRGVFDKEGNYYEAAESDKDQEAWQDVKSKEIKRAKRAHEEQMKAAEQKRIEKDMDEEYSVERLLYKLIGLLQPVESPMEALQRLNKQKPKRKSRKVEMTSEQREKEKEIQQQVTNITEYCESLIEQGITKAYELEREELMLEYRQATGSAYVRPVDKVEPKAEEKHEEEEALPNSEAKEWEFRWVGDTQVNGPYTLREIQYWKENYFQDRAEVRKVGTQEFVHISQASL